MAFNYKKLGELIELVDERNSDDKATRLLGVAIEKQFMPSVANVIGTDLTKYKVICRDRFACNPMHVGRDEKLPIARYNEEGQAIVSPAYFTFDTTTEEVLPRYLELWFTRAEFDRRCWFATDASVRGGLSWDALCDIQINVPSLEEQRAIIERFDAIERRIAQLEQLNEVLAESAEVLFSESFGDANRDMVPITTYATIGAGGDKPSKCVDVPTHECNVPIYSNGVVNEGLYGYTDKAKAKAGSITISARGTIGYICLRYCDYFPIVRLISITPKKNISSYYLYLYLRTMHIEGVGSTQQQLTAPMVKNYSVPRASADEMIAFDTSVKPIFDYITANQNEIALLLDSKQAMLSSIAGASD